MILGLAQGIALKFYKNMAKRFNLNFRKFLGLIFTFVKVTEKKLVKRAFLSHILNKVKKTGL